METCPCRSAASKSRAPAEGCGLAARAGIEIFAVRVTKPRIPDSVMRNYEKLEEERSKLLIRVETQRVMELEAETQKKKEIIEAERAAEVSAILQETKVAEKMSEQQLQEIENEVHTHRQK